MCVSMDLDHAKIVDKANKERGRLLELLAKVGDVKHMFGNI